MDVSIGRMMSALESAGIADNTLVVFTSDNGAWVNPNNGLNSNRPTKGMGPYDGGSNAPFFEGKGSTWEGGFRVPLLMSLPGVIPADQVIRTPVTGMDLYPTFLDYAQTTLPKGISLDGVSLRELIEHPVSRIVHAERQMRQKSALDRSYEVLKAKGDLSAALAVLDDALGDDLHKCIPFWREHTLFAIRCGQYKAHFITRSGFNFSDPGTVHDPPLLFNVDWDPAEAIPMNTTDPKHKLQVTYLQTQANLHVKAVIKGPSQYQAQNYSRVPCCPRGGNDTNTFDDITTEVVLSLTAEQQAKLKQIGWDSVEGSTIIAALTQGQGLRGGVKVVADVRLESVKNGVTSDNKRVPIDGSDTNLDIPWQQCVCKRVESEL